MIVLRDGTRHVMMYVDHHDRAYAWAERRKFERHPVTGSAQIVEFEEVVREEIIHVRREIAAPPLFADEDDEYLLSLGVPQAYLAAVKQVDEDGLFELCKRLPEEAQEALLELAAGERPKRTSPTQIDMLADPFAHPRCAPPLLGRTRRESAGGSAQAALGGMARVLASVATGSRRARFRWARARVGHRRYGQERSLHAPRCPFGAFCRRSMTSFY